MRLLRAFMPSSLSAPVSVTDCAAWPLPDSLEWMPAGDHTVRCTINGEAAEVTVTCGPEDAARLDTQLQALLARATAGQASRPFVDFDHEGGAAAAIPVRFFWQDGIRLAVEWTDEGSEALRGRSYSYFSPEFILGEMGNPESLQEFGAIGALVNLPAFQTIQRLAAKLASPQEDKPKGPNMEKLIAALVEAKILPSADLTDEQAAAAAATAIDALKNANKDATDAKDVAVADCEKAKCALAAARKRIAETAIAAAVQAGRVKDEATLRAKWVDAYVNDEATTQAMLDGLSTVATVTARGVSASAVAGTQDTDTATVRAKYAELTDPGERARFYAANRDRIMGN